MSEIRDLLPSVAEMRPTHIARSASFGSEPLRRAGIVAITYDFDGTLVDYNEPRIRDEFLAMLRRRHQLGFWQGAISNAKEDDRYERALSLSQQAREAISDEFFLLVSRHHEPKPSPEMFLAASDLAKCSPAKMAHVGDQLMKDMAGAYRAGYGGRILVRREGRGDDWLVRWLQRPLIEAPTRFRSGLPLLTSAFPRELMPVPAAA